MSNKFTAAELGIVVGFKLFFKITSEILALFIRAWVFMWFNWVLFQYHPFGYGRALVLSLLFVPVSWVAWFCGIRWLLRLAYGLTLFGVFIATALYWGHYVALPLFHIKH